MKKKVSVEELEKNKAKMLVFKSEKFLEEIDAETNKRSLMILERVKLLLEKEHKNIEWLAEALGFKTKATLYTGFKKGTISVKQIVAISKILNVHPFYFFEHEVIERLSDEVREYNDNHEVKSFLSGVSKELNKGVNLRIATSQIIDPNGHMGRLVM